MMPAVASPPAASRSTTTVLAPDLAKASAVARPIPFAAPVISATLPVKSNTMASSSHTLPYVSLRGAQRQSNLDPRALCRSRLLRFARNDGQRLSLPDLPGPADQRYHQVADQVLRDLVQQIALGVEFGLRLADQHLGLVQGVHVEKDAAAAQIVLGARAAGHPGRGADDRAGLAGKRLVGRTRGPVDRVFQDARHRIIVFGAGKQQRIGPGDLAPQGLNRRRKALGSNVLVVGRDLRDIRNRYIHAGRLQRDRGAQCRRVVGGLAQAAANAEYRDAGIAHAGPPIDDAWQNGYS